MTQISQDFYYRIDPSHPMVGPMSYYFAIKGAQYVSSRKDSQGTAEVLTYVGERPGDPPPVNGQPRLFIMHTYLRGRQTFSGRTSASFSRVRF